MNSNAPHHEPDKEAADGTPPGRSSFDRALAAALHDVPVPGDLADRLIARIETRAVFQRSTGDTPVPPKRAWLSRRRVLIAAGSLALLTLLALSIAYVRSTPREIAREDLSGDVTSWLSMLPAKDWRPIATLPKGIEVDSAVIAQPRRWQTFHCANSSGWLATVTAIDVAPPTAPRAILFVVRTNARFAVPSAPTASVRLGLSSGYVGTAWQTSPHLLYVLVVEADRRQRLEDFLRRPPQA